MELGNVVIGIISVLICVGPFILIYLLRVKRQNKMKQTLQMGLTDQRIKIGQHEFCGDFLIGFDTNKRNILFLKRRQNNEFSIKSIDLSSVQSCKVIKEIKTVKNNQKSIDFIEQIDLSILTIHKKEERLELFNDDDNTQLNGELQCAEKWAQWVNEQLK
jgi:hypothetical protein